MFYIVEDDSQLQLLQNIREKKCYIELITSNHNYHPKLSFISLIYIRIIDQDKGYIIPILHDEGMNVDLTRIQSLINSIDEVYVLDKKNFLYFFSHKNIVDISLLYSLNEYEQLEMGNTTRQYNSMYHKHPTKPDINCIIPISIHYQNCEQNFDVVARVFKRYKSFLEDPSWSFYNNLYVGVFYLMESFGIRYQYGNFEEIYKPNFLAYNTYKDQMFTCYNLNNVTSRPSNAFNSINFAAIPHKENYRRAFIARNDYLIEFDFDGYHIRLIADTVGYEFTSESIHKQLGRLYFEKEELTDEEYKESKNTTFQILYGGIPSKWRYIEFFDLVHHYIQKTWNEFTEKGEIRCPISNRRYTREVGEMNSQKLFNYIIQNLETSRNVVILKKVLGFLRDKKTKAVLYTYDAILFDYSKEDGREILIELKNLLSEENKYPVKMKYGKDYLLTN
jgi:hypothetical protein